MLVERTNLTVNAGAAEGFAEAMATTGLPLLRAVDGVAAVRFGRGVEAPDTFLLLIDWQSMAAHTAFWSASAYPEFRALLAPFTVSGSMEHFEMD